MTKSWKHKVTYHYSLLGISLSLIGWLWRDYSRTQKCPVTNFYHWVVRERFGVHDLQHRPFGIATFRYGRISHSTTVIFCKFFFVRAVRCKFLCIYVVKVGYTYSMPSIKFYVFNLCLMFHFFLWMPESEKLNCCFPSVLGFLINLLESRLILCYTLVYIY